MGILFKVLSYNREELVSELIFNVFFYYPVYRFNLYPSYLQSDAAPLRYNGVNWFLIYLKHVATHIVVVAKRVHRFVFSLVILPKIAIFII